jgi:hypothetical protein
MFQIVRVMLDEHGASIARRPLQPFFERREAAMAIAQMEASGLWGHYGYDEELGCWWATDTRDRKYRFVVEDITTAENAA